VRTGHAELELVAREGEGARAVAVGVVLREERQRLNAQVDLGLPVADVFLAFDDGLNDRAELIA